MSIYDIICLEQQLHLSQIILFCEFMDIKHIRNCQFLHILMHIFAFLYIAYANCFLI